MGEQAIAQINKEEDFFEENKLRETIKEKVIKYLTDNETVLTLKTLVLYANASIDVKKALVEKLAKCFISLKRNLFDINIDIKNRETYGYTIDELILESVEIRGPFFNPDVTIVLPNGVTVAWVFLSCDDRNFLRKEIFEEVKKREEELERILFYLKELVKQTAENK
jgi:predicted Zn-ribbon and HTH transcriptional regulator